ncbi:MAG: hypothetical protein JNL10_08475 [Verrucomicrobiales bacterium]|nr:hypothetical protein [Verrucomicrobiales bacterium]
MYRSLAILCLAAVISGCGRKAAESAPPAPAPVAASPSTDAASSPEGSAPAPAPEVGDVRSLKALVESNPSPVVRNNAKAALDSWNGKDYASAVVFLKTVMGLPEAQLQGAEIASVLAAMQSELQRAASGGNRAAQQALQDLAPPAP